MKKTALLVMLASLPVMAMTDEEAAGTVMAAMGGMVLFIAAVALIIQIFFILSVNKTIRAVKTEHSRASEVMAWLMLIPFVGWIFAIITVMKLAGDYKVYVQQHQLTELYHKDGGQTKGLVAFIASLCGIIPVIGVIAGIIGFVFYILYWIELGNLRTSIAVARSNSNA